MVAECHQTAIGSSPGTWAQQAKDFAGVGNPTQGQKVRERREPACGHHAGLAIGFSSRVHAGLAIGFSSGVGSGTLEKLEVEL
jgi:hypothetical protein